MLRCRDLGLAWEASSGIEAMLAVDQCQPFTLPIGLEPGDVQGAAFEESEIRGAVIGRVCALTDKVAKYIVK